MQMSSVIVLGAKGRFGRAAFSAFAAAGWSVTRAGRGLLGPGCVDVDATDSAALIRACAGHDVIVHAVNPPYHHWADAVPKLTAAVIAAARMSGATVMVPGNVYNYGTSLPTNLTEATPWVVSTRKGGIRIRMEDAFRDSGVRTIVLRGGDFIEAAQTGNWFDSHIAHKVRAGVLTYPGPQDRVHAWAYVPDMARACVALAGRRSEFATFEEFGFTGYALTGEDLAMLVQEVVGRPIRVRGFPWAAVRVAALWSPLMREVLEMRYLWDRPHQIDGTKLRNALPGFIATPAEQAIAEALGHHTPADAKLTAAT